MKKIITHPHWVVILTVLLFHQSCKNNSLDEEDRKLRMVYTEWTESVAITHLAAVLLEEQMDYDIELKLTDIASAYQEVAENKSDIFADAWLPETHKAFIDQYREELESIGIIYPEARTGFVVPSYSELESVSDLKNYPYDLIGIDSDAGVMQKARIAIKQYDLPLNLLNLSETEMIKHLEDSIKRRKEVVVTGWEPHWVFARYDLRFLKDPDNIFGKKENIHSIGRTGLGQDHPHAVRFFERMQLTEKQLNQLVYFVRLSEDPKAGVKNWMKENEYIVNQWVKNLKPERKKIM